LLQSKLVDGDLNKIASPLRPKGIESAKLTATDDNPFGISTMISSAERDYFRPDPLTSTTSETEVIGNLVSLNKETNRGTFRLGNKTGVSYRYIGEDPQKFHAEFSYKGPVRALCLVEFDQNLTPIHLDIKDIQRLQGEFGFLPSGEESN
jgi:hypothetical protein